MILIGSYKGERDRTRNSLSSLISSRSQEAMVERKRSPSLSVVDVVARLGTSGLGILFAESPTDNSWIFANEPQLVAPSYGG